MSHIRRKRKCSLNQLPNFTFINFSDILSGTKRGSGLRLILPILISRVVRQPPLPATLLIRLIQEHVSPQSLLTLVLLPDLDPLLLLNDHSLGTGLVRAHLVSVSLLHDFGPSGEFGGVPAF